MYHYLTKINIRLREIARYQDQLYLTRSSQPEAGGPGLPGVEMCNYVFTHIPKGDSAGLGSLNRYHHHGGTDSLGTSRGKD